MESYKTPIVFKIDVPPSIKKHDNFENTLGLKFFTALVLERVAKSKNEGYSGTKTV